MRLVLLFYISRKAGGGVYLSKKLTRRMTAANESKEYPQLLQ